MPHRIAAQTHGLPGYGEQVENHRRRILTGNHTKLVIVCGALLIAIGAITITFQHVWPFTPKGITRRLQQHSSATVEFGSFRQLFFPRPGFVAEQVILRAGPSSPPAVTIERLTVLSSYSGLISKSISRVEADGLVVHVWTGHGSHNLQFHAGPAKKNERELKVDQLVADGSRLQVTSGEGDEPTVFPISRLRMNNLGNRSVITFDVALQNPKPTMQIAAQGELGPWRTDEVLLTPVSGSYVVSHGEFGSIRGLEVSEPFSA